MITAKQERDEPVRQFAAHLCGLAAVCDLSVTCSCGNKVSEVEKWVRLSLIGGLNDEDTKQEVLSKVEEMPLDTTITFVEARETGKTALKILGGKLTSSQVNQMQERVDLRPCNYCGQKGHGKSPNIDTRKAKCPAHGKKCTKCQREGHYAKVCKSGKGDKSDDTQPDSKKTTAGTSHFTINRMKISERSGKISRVSQSTQNLMKKQQNMKKLRHKVWDEREGMYIKSKLPEEPKLKIRMCVDVMAYRSHKPCVQLSMRDDWYANLGPSKQQKDVVLKTSIADTGAQCFLLGSNHLHGLGLDVSNLLQSEINLNCANSTAAGNLGVFFAKVRGEHHETEEVVESRTMVYVIEGDIILVSRAILETLGCIPKTFPQVEQFLTDDDDALTGRAFAVNPDPIGLRSDGTKDPDIPEAVARTVDKPKHVEPSANAAVAGKTSYKASKMAGTRAGPPEVAREIFKKEEEYSWSPQTSCPCPPRPATGR